MNTQEKKEMLIKLAEELKEELGEDEKLLLACSFDDKDKDEIVMYADLTYVGAVLCAICNDEGMNVSEFIEFISYVKLMYMYINLQKEGNEE